LNDIAVLQAAEQRQDVLLMLVILFLSVKGSKFFWNDLNLNGYKHSLITDGQADRLLESKYKENKKCARESTTRASHTLERLSVAGAEKM
jgi:hypothetical protein